MPKKELASYIKSLMQKGYDFSRIKQVLLRYGYSSSEVEDAVNSIYKPTMRHEIHLSSGTTLVVVFVIAALIGTASFFYYYKPEAKATGLLDLNLEPITTTVEPGQSIVFVKELSNLGSLKRYDVVIKQEIIEPLTNKMITQKIETRAIETFGSTQTRILIPEDTKKGDYILRAIVEYENKKAVATLPVKVVAFAKKESCFDGIKNQNEENADCGGICKQCKKESLECNDNNMCTEDSAENGICSNKPIAPCCGNSICEEGEIGICAADCRKAEELPIVAPTETLEQIKELSRTNPAKALQDCNAIEVPDLKDTCIGNIGDALRDKSYCIKIDNPRIRDLCYSTIAKAVNDNSLCEQISIDSRKDSCYMTFVLDNKDYSVCDRISNKHLRQSCESLRQLNEINEQQSQQGVNG